MARIAIVGVGAIGGVTAALLQQAGGHELFLCTRRPTSRLVVDTPNGIVNLQATFVTIPDKSIAVDWVIVATKAYDVAGAAKWLEVLCSKGAPVAV
ncbi:MAG: ketopantoate reductase family protein, partial [Edaphobacter sp.]